MTARTPLLATLLILTAFAAFAAGQAQTVDTVLHTSEPEPEIGWSAGMVNRTIEVSLCYGQNGVNLFGGSFIIHIEVEIPDWMNATHPESVTLTPPMGPTDEPGCTDPAPFIVDLGAPDGILGNASVEVHIRLSAEAETDDETGQPTTGNYERPDDVTVTFNVTTVATPHDAREEDGDEDDANGIPGVPAFLVLLVIAVLLANERIRRR